LWWVCGAPFGAQNWPCLCVGGKNKNMVKFQEKNMVQDNRINNNKNQ
jgi:hypothetical protein